jgi:DNA-binding response OmpR family regulator
MEDLQPRRLEALSAHIEGMEAALAALEAEGSLDSLRRLARSLARASEQANLLDVAARARAMQGVPASELPSAARELLDFLVAQLPSDAEEHDHHVLVVEDDATTATALTSYLKQEGRMLHLAATAAEAERLLRAHPIDLIVLDLILPDRDGRDLLLQLREDPDAAAVPVIVLSARAGAVARAECLAVGASDFLEKPADPKLLRSAVSFHLSQHQRDADARSDPTTGTFSRAGLTEAYRALRSRTGRVEGPLAVALLCVEPLDLFLRTLGREAADDLMRGVAEHTTMALEERDELGRWSEAELLALLPGTNPHAARGRLADGLSRLIATGVLERHAESGIDVWFSAGIAVADAGADLREAAFEAERSVQRARRAGDRLTFEAESSEPEGSPRVLLVEDDRVTATLIQHRLVREGFEVMDFLNGEDAFRWASGGSFDLAILDVKVPGMDGFEILERLRAIPRHAEVPIIMLTGLGGEADVVRGLELGANDYMLKPFSPAELLARVRRLALDADDSSRPPHARGGDPSGVKSP